MTTFTDQIASFDSISTNDVHADVAATSAASPEIPRSIPSIESYPITLNLRQGISPCSGCLECDIEQELVKEFGSGIAQISPQASARRYELLRKATKRKKIGNYISAKEIAFLPTAEERYDAISLRLQEYRSVRGVRPVSCDAFWGLRDEHDGLSDGIFLTLPTREAHDEAFRRLQRKAK